MLIQWFLNLFRKSPKPVLQFDTTLFFFINGYTEAALWTSTNQDLYDGGKGPDIALASDYAYSDFSAAAVERTEDDCKRFIELAQTHLENFVAHPNHSIGEAGRYFWYARNRLDLSKELKGWSNPELEQIALQFEPCNLVMKNDVIDYED